MYTIEITNRQDFVDVDEDLLREVVEKTLTAEETAQADVSLAVVDNPTIRELNQRHLDRDSETDVLSFLFSCEESVPIIERGSANGLSALRGRGKSIDGEVIVSGEMAAQRAEEFGWNRQQELVLYVVHGVLHLLGYDDRDEDESRLMRSRERTILDFWRLTRGAER